LSGREGTKGKAPKSMADQLRTYREFWPHYLRQHRTPACRAAHYIGTGLTLVALALAIGRANPWWLLAMPLAGYGCAWFGHFRLEHNVPATFGHPVWSLFSDYRMTFLWVTGRLGPHLSEASA